jgi:RNA-directed DNA polymerase
VNREWKPAVAYCRYADDLVVIVKGTKAHAEAIREECRAFLEGKLKLTLNMEKTHITHVNDGFVFLGHRIIRKRGSSGRMAVVRTIPKEKAKAFAHRLSMALSGDHDLAKVDIVDRLNRQLGAGRPSTSTRTSLRPRSGTSIMSCSGKWRTAGEKVSEPHQTTDAELVSSTGRWASQDLVCPRGQ